MVFYLINVQIKLCIYIYSANDLKQENGLHQFIQLKPFKTMWKTKVKVNRFWK